MKILAVETSCDETAASVVVDGKTVLSNVILSQMDIHAAFGGVVPEVASRHHVVSIHQVMDEALANANVTASEIDVVAVTMGPGLIGALMVGINAAKTFSYIHHIPLLGVDHLRGHIHAISLTTTMKFPLLALIVSGGHTELVLMSSSTEYVLLGATKDDAVGEAYDKVARVLGLGYPGGPVVDQYAEQGQPTYELPIPMKEDDSFDFSFSGLKSAVINLIHNANQKQEPVRVADMCASFQHVVTEVLVNQTLKAARQYHVVQIAVVGGVSANRELRKKIMAHHHEFEIVVPAFEFCTDNAAMIGAAAYASLQAKAEFDTIELDATVFSDITR
jgi:N6-L-threonylcarbamoyladenine synthase